MRNVVVLIGICMLVGLGLTVGARQQAPADLDATMKAIGPLNQGLAAKIMAGDGAGIAADAARLETLFGQTEAFFTAKNIKAGVDWARESKAAASELAKAAKANNMEAAKAATGKFACKACHTAHRAKAADGSFTFKAQ
jgi:hypothetical protein